MRVARANKAKADPVYLFERIIYMKKYLLLLVLFGVLAGGALPAEASGVSLSISVGDRPYYHAPHYWHRFHRYVWVPGHWVRARHHRHVWVHGYYVRA